jgi:phthiodiolone/phenolphthiodiolone dimycocerosates ketoreductase
MDEGELMTPEDRAFIAEHAPKIAFCGGLGLEIWRPSGVQDTLTGIQILDKLGYPFRGMTEQTQSWTFRSIWGDEPMSKEVPEYEAFYDTFALIAAAGPMTEQITFRTTTDCYRRPPSVMAQTMLTLDHLTKGRIAVFVGTGENKQFLPHGLSRDLPRNERLGEFIRITRALIRSTEPVTMESNFWPQQDGLIALPPYDPAKPPPVYMVGGGPLAMKIAGTEADGLRTNFPGAYTNLEAWEHEHALFRQAAVDAGRDPDSLDVSGAILGVLCESDEQVTRALDSQYLRSSLVNLTPNGKHWHRWGGQHPISDDWALSVSHRSTMFTREEVLDITSRITDEDIQKIVYVGNPEELAARFAPWCKVAGIKAIGLGAAVALNLVIFPEHHELAEDGLPRWYHLDRRFRDEVNRLLAA